MLQTYLLPPPNQPLTLPETTPPPSSNPPLFDAAMAVRIAVFVTEQHVPLDNELDDDDRRSWHWVIFDSSPATPSSILSPTTITEDPSRSPGEKEWEHGRKGRARGRETERGTPIAVLRLVPPPHPPHESFSHPETAASRPRYDLRSEPCVRITRVAVLPAYRGLGLGRQLVEMAVRWAGSHAEEVQRVYEETIRGYGDVDGGGDGNGHGEDGRMGRFDGLVLAHAQTSVEGMYARLGFEGDERLGRWEEEGIEHVGMTVRVPLAPASSYGL